MSIYYIAIRIAIGMGALVIGHIGERYSIEYGQILSSIFITISMVMFLCLEYRLEGKGEPNNKARFKKGTLDFHLY